MEYRKLRGGELVSTIGIGSAHLHELSQKGIEELFRFALQNEVNFVDLVMSYQEPLAKIGKALQGKREKFVLQMHLGMAFPGGQYQRTRDLSLVKSSFEAQLALLGTEYVDILLIHYVDEVDDFAAVINSGMYAYAKQLKEEGIAKYIGFASHDVAISRKFIEAEEVDICMFSINAAYDMNPVVHLPFDEYVPVEDQEVGAAEKRIAFYKECEKKGIGISVMKPYGGGLLLDEKTSPLGQAMTIPQCLAYALDRPAVFSCLLGVRSVQDLSEALQYYKATIEEKDYTFIADLQPTTMRGVCVYCNHCLPCPSHIDIAAVHKYLDLYVAGDQLAKEHYALLKQNAKDCILCGACEERCPFGVAVREKMQQAVELMV